MATYTSKTAVIIGGTHGIGLSTAKLLIAGGARVVITGRRREPVAAAKVELNGVSALVVQSDITSRAAHAELRSQVEEYLGGSRGVIDLLFVNAGYAILGPFMEVTEEAFDRTFNTNTRGAFFVTQTLIPLVKPGGSIVFTTSVSIGAGYPGMATYSASKAAVYSLVQTMASELVKGKDGQPGIRVNAVSPGFVDTPTGGVIEESQEHVDLFKDIGAKTTPIGRISTAEEVAKAVLFLAFDATYTTGIEYVMDGGSRFLQMPMQ